MLLLGGKGEKSARIHIFKAILGAEIAEILFKPLPIINEASRSRQSRPRTDHHRVSAIKGLLQLRNLR